MYTVETAQQFLDGFAFTYNHIRDHMALKGKTPGEVAGMDVPFREWADVVRADIEVPAEWKREAKRRTPRKKNHEKTKKGYRKRPQKGREEPVRGIQLGAWRHKKPTKKDRERVEAHAKARAPEPPRMERRLPKPEYDTQSRLMHDPRLPIPKARMPIPVRMVRPKPAGRRRRH